MKIKSFNKKLSLNKKTVVNLDNNQMTAVKGGWHTYYTCDFCDTVLSCMETLCHYCEENTFLC